MVFFASTHITHAAGPFSWLGISTNDITGGLVSALAFLISALFASIFGVAIAVEAWLLNIVLNINDLAFQTVFVQSGFSIALSVANLAFVLGIIVIAIATIIRSQNYGIKKLLWKLVVAAVLVNFGLVIAAPIFGLGNSFSHYFVNCISPTSGGCTGNSSVKDSYENFVTSFAGAFQPQDNFTTLNNQISAQDKNSSELAGAFSVKGTDFGKSLVPILGIVFALINLILIAVVLGGFIILLLVRFIYISILAILMPFAWASWVFPAFGNHWKKWWSKFLQWTFFAPIAFFFIYLAMLLMQASKGTAGGIGGIPLPSCGTGGANCTAASTIFTSLSALFTGFFTPILVAFVQEIIFVALILGGLMAANSMGIKGAGAITNGITSMGNATKNWASKKTKQTAGRMVPKTVKENLQSGKYGILPKRLQVATGVGLGNLERAGRGDMVAEQAKLAEKYAKDPEAFARIISGEAGTMGRGTVSKEGQMAMLVKLAKDEDLQKEVIKAQGVGSLKEIMVGEKNLQSFLEANKEEFTKLQQGKLYEDLRDKTGLTLDKAAKDKETAQNTIQNLGKKADLQEIKGLLPAYKDPETFGILSQEEKNKVEAYIGKKKGIEDAIRHGDVVSEEERNELNEMNKMESLSGDYISKEEKEQLNKAKGSLKEANDKIKSFARKNPDLMSDYFQDFEGAAKKLADKKKEIPLTFNPESVRRVQESIIATMAEGFSSQNASKLIKSISDKNNMKYFLGAAKNMNAETKQYVKTLAEKNTDLANWIRRSPGANAYDLGQIFGMERGPRNRNDQR